MEWPILKSCKYYSELGDTHMQSCQSTLIYFSASLAYSVIQGAKQYMIYKRHLMNFIHFPSEFQYC